MKDLILSRIQRPETLKEKIVRTDYINCKNLVFQNHNKDFFFLSKLGKRDQAVYDKGLISLSPKGCHKSTR